MARLIRALGNATPIKAPQNCASGFNLVAKEIGNGPREMVGKILGRCFRQAARAAEFFGDLMELAGSLRPSFGRHHRLGLYSSIARPGADQLLARNSRSHVVR